MRIGYFPISPIGTRYGEGHTVRICHCCVGPHVVDLHHTRFPLLAEFSVGSDPFSVTRVCARESVIGRFDDPTVGSDIRQLRSSSLIISYFWGFSRIFWNYSGNREIRPVRFAQASLLFSWDVSDANLEKYVLGKLFRTSFLIFCDFPKLFWVRGCGSDPGFRSGFSPS